MPSTCEDELKEGSRSSDEQHNAFEEQYCCLMFTCICLKLFPTFICLIEQIRALFVGSY